MEIGGIKFGGVKFGAFVDTRVFTGFGNAVTVPHGKLRLNLGIDAQMLNTELFVVQTNVMYATIFLGEELVKDVDVHIRRGQIILKALPKSERSSTDEFETMCSDNGRDVQDRMTNRKVEDLKEPRQYIDDKSTCDVATYTMILRS